MVGQPIDTLIKIFIIDQILFSLFFIISLTLQANFAGSCHATSCGHSASQSTRYSLGLLGCVGRSSCYLFVLLFYNILTEKRKMHIESWSFLIFSYWVVVMKRRSCFYWRKQHHKRHMPQPFHAIYWWGWSWTHLYKFPLIFFFNIENFNYGLEKRMIWNTKVFKVHFVGLNNYEWPVISQGAESRTYRLTFSVTQWWTTDLWVGVKYLEIHLL